ncbi:MAG: hypothetical protein A2096_14940 [Spirochaetes bacterium GWF1_41_5]|nr:MAG: hypothetical protein A2096_14940 [Spirochaetes bacterium GWF1_41_5]
MAYKILLPSDINLEPFFPLKVKMICAENGHCYSWHGHQFCEIGYTVSGSAEHITRSSRRILKKGDIYLLQPGESHEIHVISNWQMYNVLFLPALVEDEIFAMTSVPQLIDFFLYTFILDRASGIDLHADEEKQAEIIRLVSSLEKPAVFSARLGSIFSMHQLLCLFVLFADIFHSSLKNPTSIADFIRVIRLIENMIANGKEPGVNALAGSFGYTPEYFTTLFKKKTGKSLKDYILMRKITKACVLLLKSPLNNTQIALSLGFYDLAHFNRYFKKITSLTPGNYRKKTGF